jgi:hypothetical protein
MILSHGNTQKSTEKGGAEESPSLIELSILP